MGQIGRAALKAYFETGDIPTESEFIDLIDSLLNFVDDGTPEDINVKISIDDITKGYLIDKIAAGANVTLSTLNPGANEQIEIDTEVIKSGATQSAAGALDGELWKTLGHATLPDNVTMVGIEVFSTEYQAVYDSFTIKPVDSIALEQNTMVKGLVSSGVWAKEDVIYVFAAHTNDNSEALVNWKNPGTNDAAIILNGGTMNFTAFEGFQSSDEAYINTNFNAFTSGVNYQLNDAAVSVYSRLNIDSLFRIYGCGDTPNSTFLYPRHTNGDFFVTINEGLFTDTLAVADSLGMYISNRLSVNSTNLYKNKINIIDGTGASVGVPNANMGILANIGTAVSNFYPGQVSYFAMGSGSTQQNVDDETDYFEAYMDSNGKGVIT